MRTYLISRIAGAVALLCSLGLYAHAQTPNPGDKGQMRQLAQEYCSKTANEQVCGCFADNLVKNLNEKEWRIFIADTSNSSAPPSGVGQSDIDNYGKKLAAAGNACGLQ